jgi:hypothetical protein
LWPEIEERSIFWQTETWRLGRADDETVLLGIHVWPDERPLTIARFAPDFASGDLRRRAGRHGASTPFALNYPCDQIAVLNALTPRGVGIVHAGAVMFDGSGLLFCGKSGAGKTTLSRLCRSAGAVLLNDDRQFVWVDPRGTWMAPTPWHGLEPEINNRTVPLRAIFHLAHASHDRISPMSIPEAAARLLGNTVAPFYFAGAMERALAWAESVAESVPSFRLEFTPTQSAVRLCRSAAGLPAGGG